MGAILFKSGAGAESAWKSQLESRLGPLDWRVWPEVGDPADIEFTLLFRAEPGFFAQFPNLRAILSTGAGVDGIFRDPDLPRHLPMARIVDPHMTTEMVQWALWGILNFRRQFPDYAALQAKGEWRELPHEERPPAKVGILGCGEIGGAIGRTLAGLDFEVTGWTRSPRDLGPIRNMAGAGALDDFLAGAQFLVCMLPLTDDTRGILNAALFEKLPKGAVLVNLARGGHANQDDLIAALESGRLAGAFLDVTDPEPLPADHPLWQAPNCIITPHCSGITTPATAAMQVAENIRRARAGEPLLNAVDAGRGY